MRETSKAAGRREAEGWFERYFLGDVIDIGCGDDPVTPWCVRWDLPQGDAQVMEGVDPESFDTVYSSNCLEHMVDAVEAIIRWWELVRPGGHLIVVVPDEDLYEQGEWPSRWNEDHKWTFSISKGPESWSPVHIDLCDLIALLPDHQVVMMRTVDFGYDHSPGVWDRTLTGGEAFIEVVVKKLIPDG